MKTRGAVILDLDGTITRPILDFDAIRAEIGMPPAPILEAMKEMDPQQRSRAERILEVHEARAARECEMQPGASETIGGLRRAGWPVAVLTRNAARWSAMVLERFGIEVDAIRTREDGVIKPSPEGVLDLCRRLGADSGRSWMIGDHLFDLRAGRAAGARTILFVSEHNEQEAATEAYRSHADFLIRCFAELPALVGNEANGPDPGQ